MLSRPLGDSRIGVAYSASGDHVLLQITDADGEQARAVLSPDDCLMLIGWLHNTSNLVREFIKTGRPIVAVWEHSTRRKATDEEVRILSGEKP